MMADHFRHDEIEEFLGKGRVEAGLLRHITQPFDLFCLAGLVCGRKVMLRLQLADLLGQLEALGQRMNEDGIEIVDAVAELAQLTLIGSAYAS